MRKTLVLYSILVANATIGHCQRISIGARVGLTVSNQHISGQDLPSGYTNELSRRTSILAGVYGICRISDKIGIQPELLFSSLGSKDHSHHVDDGGLRYHFSTTIDSKGINIANYLSLPILIRYSLISNKFQFVVGPQVNLLLTAKRTSTTTAYFVSTSANPSVSTYTEDQDLKPYYNSIDFGGVF